MKNLHLIDRVRTIVQGLVDSFGNIPDKVPPKGDESLAEVVEALFDEAKKSYDSEFSGSSERRFGYSDPGTWARDQEKIESGNHWGVYGRRNQESGKEWMQEVVDDETSDQIRARAAYLCSNWHDVQVDPNIANINDILNVERKATDWGKTVRRMVKHMGTYGHVWVQSYLDKSTDPRGVATEKILRHGSLYLSPFAVDKQKNSGCWYCVIPSMVTGQWVHEAYPKLKLKELEEASGDFLRKVGTREGLAQESKYTKLYPMYEVFMDDGGFEDVPFDEEEFMLRVQMLLEGQDAPPQEGDNHLEFIKRWLEFLDERVALSNQERDESAFTPEDEAGLDGLIGMVNATVEEHLTLAKQSGLPAGKRKKYPFGRHIIQIGGEIADDENNPYEFDWRYLITKVDNEEVVGRSDARSDVEILYNVQKAMDQNLSRFQDAAILQGIKKPWFHVDDRSTVENDGYTNDPTKPGYFERAAPTFPDARMPIEFLSSYEKHKQNAVKKIGVSDVSFGKAPTSNASGDLVEALIQQNQTLITGEPSQSLNDAIEDILETRIMIMRQFYTEPRMYPINGQQVALNLSDLLSYTEVEDGKGGVVRKELPKIEVTVRPESNFPFRWERTITLLSKLAEIKYSDGTSAIPTEMLMDILSERYLQLGPKGKYRHISQITQMGMQAMQEKQAADKEGQDTLDEVKRKFRHKQVAGVVDQILPGQVRQPSQQ